MSKAIIPIPRIAQRIVFLRGERVLLDFDLAALYDVETRVLNQAVKRNTQRFPSDFMFQLSEQEMERVSQFVIPSAERPEKKDATNSSQSVMSSRKHRGNETGAIIDAIRQLMATPEKPPREIGFHVRERSPRYRTRNNR